MHLTQVNCTKKKLDAKQKRRWIEQQPLSEPFLISYSPQFSSRPGVNKLNHLRLKLQLNQVSAHIPRTGVLLWNVPSFKILLCYANFQNSLFSKNSLCGIIQLDHGGRNTSMVGPWHTGQQHIAALNVGYGRVFLKNSFGKFIKICHT